MQMELIHITCANAPPHRSADDALRVRVDTEAARCHARDERDAELLGKRQRERRRHGLRGHGGDAHAAELHHHLRRAAPAEDDDLVRDVDVVAQRPAIELVKDVVAADVLAEDEDLLRLLVPDDAAVHAIRLLVRRGELCEQLGRQGYRWP